MGRTRNRGRKFRARLKKSEWAGSGAGEGITPLRAHLVNPEKFPFLRWIGTLFKRGRNDRFVHTFPPGSARRKCLSFFRGWLSRAVINPPGGRMKTDRKLPQKLREYINIEHISAPTLLALRTRRQIWNLSRASSQERSKLKSLLVPVKRNRNYETNLFL